jgi:hypothetical protein
VGVLSGDLLRTDANIGKDLSERNVRRNREDEEALFLQTQEEYKRIIHAKGG